MIDTASLHRTIEISRSANGDRRQPHPDLEPPFAGAHSNYLYGADGLNAELVAHFGSDFAELAGETELVREEPRTLAEILEAEREYFDKIWYVRKLILDQKIESGEREPLSAEMIAQTRAAMRAIEERYGAENVGPWDDRGWGFVHGSSPLCDGYSAASGTSWTPSPWHRGAPGSRPSVHPRLRSVAGMQRAVQIMSGKDGATRIGPRVPTERTPGDW